MSKEGKRAICPSCKREVTLYPQLDGLNRPMNDRPFRFGIHAGTKWGRQCANSGELENLRVAT